MPATINTGYPITVKVTADWTTAATAWLDIEPVLKSILPVEFPLKQALTIVLIEGEEDTDDIAKFAIAANDTPSWTTAFTTVPSSGFVYILSMYF